jgi:hypothetical protein
MSFTGGEVKTAALGIFNYLLGHLTLSFFPT